MEKSSTLDVMYRIKRGLSGYVSYLAACEMNEAFSEYVLYEPTLRILTARGYTVRCEVPCPGLPNNNRGDKKRIDFVAQKQDEHFSIEIKWARHKKLNVERDYEKLDAFRKNNKNSRAFLCVFGRKSIIEEITLSPNAFAEKGKSVYAEFGVTRYGSRVFELTNA